MVADVAVYALIYTDGKVYIGSSSDPERRASAHRGLCEGVPMAQRSAGRFCRLVILGWHDRATASLVELATICEWALRHPERVMNRSLSTGTTTSGLPAYLRQRTLNNARLVRDNSGVCIDKMQGSLTTPSGLYLFRPTAKQKARRVTGGAVRAGDWR